MKSTTCIISFLAIALALFGFAARGQDGISKDRAIALARNFVKIAKLSEPTQRPHVRSMPASSVFSDEWVVDFPGEYRFNIRKGDGVVASFTNDRRIYEQFKRTQNRTLRRFATGEAAKPYVQSLANRLGLVPQAKLEKIEFVRDGDPAGTDANRAGRIYVKYRTTPFGYGFFGSSIGNGMGFTIDPVDGTLVTFAQTWHTKIASHVVKVTRAKATAVAKGAFRSYRQKNKSFHTTSDQAIVKVELKYVLPNAAFGSTYPNRQREKLARLAYIVYFGSESVWIDAATGKLLGGQAFA
jgi:hypothetical protein